jgi:allantoinase
LIGIWRQGRRDERQTGDAADRSALRGWLGPGLTETWDTPDLPVEAGYEYVSDWVLDDEPVWLKRRTRPIVNLPYT